MVARIGKKRHRVSFEERTKDLDARGQSTNAWAVTEYAWAEVVTLTGTELEIARKLHANATHKVTLRYFAGRSTKQRINLGDRTLNILSIDNVDQRGIEHVLICGEAV